MEAPWVSLPARDHDQWQVRPRDLDDAGSPGSPERESRRIANLGVLLAGGIRERIPPARVT